MQWLPHKILECTCNKGWENPCTWIHKNSGYHKESQYLTVPAFCTSSIAIASWPMAIIRTNTNTCQFFQQSIEAHLSTKQNYKISPVEKWRNWRSQFSPSLAKHICLRSWMIFQYISLTEEERKRRKCYYLRCKESLSKTNNCADKHMWSSLKWALKNMNEKIQLNNDHKPHSPDLVLQMAGI